MQVQTIQSNNYNTLSFGELQITKGGKRLIKSLPNKANVWRKINSWKRELAETKYFNLQIDGLSGTLRMSIRSKNPCISDDCEAPLHVKGTQEGKRLKLFGTDLVDCGDWVSYQLKFKTKKDAQDAYNTLKCHQDNVDSITEITKMQWAVSSVKILEQAYENMINPKKENPESEIKKLPLRIRIKNAFQALKG